MVCRDVRSMQHGPRPALPAGYMSDSSRVSGVFPASPYVRWRVPVLRCVLHYFMTDCILLASVFFESCQSVANLPSMEFVAITSWLVPLAQRRSLSAARSEAAVWSEWALSSRCSQLEIEEPAQKLRLWDLPETGAAHRPWTQTNSTAAREKLPRDAAASGFGISQDNTPHGSCTEACQRLRKVTT